MGVSTKLMDFDQKNFPTLTKKLLSCKAFVKQEM